MRHSTADQLTDPSVPGWSMPPLVHPDERSTAFAHRPCPRRCHPAHRRVPATGSAARPRRLHRRRHRRTDPPLHHRPRARRRPADRLQDPPRLPLPALRKAFRDAVVVDQFLPSNPVERAKRPRQAHSEPGQVWTPAQLRAFLDTARQHRLSAFYRLAAYTGARRGELLNLRWRDVDLDHGEVRITGSAAVIAGQRIEGSTKSGRSRTVSIDPGTVQELREHHKRQAEERLRAGPGWRGTDDYMFSTAWGEPIHPDTVSSLMPTAYAHARQHPKRPARRAATSCPAARSAARPRHDRFCWLASPCTWSPPGSVTPTRRSHCACTRTSSAISSPRPPTSSPVP